MDVMNLPPGDEHDSRLASVRSDIDQLDDGYGLRLDSLVYLEKLRSLFLIDISVVQTLAFSYKDREFKHQQQRFANQVSSLAPPKDREPGPHLKSRSKSKRRVYANLMLAANRLFEAGRLSAQPVLVPVVLSALGELDSGAFKIQELLTTVYTDQLARQTRYDGISSSVLAAEFRQQFRLDLMLALIRGGSRMQRNAGQYPDKYRNLIYH